jgi:hypothetical protein
MAIVFDICFPPSCGVSNRCLGKTPESRFLLARCKKSRSE